MRQSTVVVVFLILLFRAPASFSQCAIRSTVTDTLKAPVSFITVALLKEDSSIYKGAMTGEKGEFCFSDIRKGNYFIRISAVGFATWFSDKLSYDSISPTALNTIELKKSGITLDEVSVSVIKNPIEFKGGNITVNVEDSPLSVGNSVYDLIARLPGVMVEGDNISIQGKSGVRVYINDRIQQLSGAQLVNFLRGMSASVVEKIEIINNPPSRYDAAGGAGIINIKTKKIKITGASGGLNYTFSQGFYTTNTAGFALNYKAKNVTFFSNTEFYDGLLHSQSNMRSDFTFNGNTTSLDQKSHENDGAKYVTIDLGADWYVNKKNTIGVKAQAIPGSATRTIRGNTQSSDNSLGYNNLSFSRPNYNYWLLCNFNINAEHVFDTAGTTKLKFSGDYYGPYYDNYKADYENRFLGMNGSDTLLPRIFRTTNDLTLDILALRVDFEKTFKKDLSIEAGLKQSNSTAQSNYLFENKNMLTGDYSVDSIFTNKFKYHEQISSAYISLDKKYKKFNFRTGLRGENTNIHTESLTNSIKYTRSYFNVFPVISTDYNPNKNHSFGLSYNRRINRPDYNSFNPFRSFNNLLNSSEGNPYLLPVYDNNFNFNYIYKGFVANYLSFSHSENPIFGYITQNDSTKEIVNHVQNMKNLNLLRYTFFVRQEVAKWCMLSFLAGGYYIDYTGVVNGTNFTAQKVPWYTRLSSIFTLKEKTKIELSGFYWSPWLGNTAVFQERWGVSMAVKRSLLDDKLNISISLNDAFFSEPFREKADFQNQKWSRFQSNDSRRLNISLSYNFGRIKAEQRDTKENEEERRRAGSGK